MIDDNTANNVPGDVAEWRSNSLKFLHPETPVLHGRCAEMSISAAHERGSRIKGGLGCHAKWGNGYLLTTHVQMSMFGCSYVE